MNQPRRVAWGTQCLRQHDLEHYNQTQPSSQASRVSIHSNLLAGFSFFSRTLLALVETQAPLTLCEFWF